LRDVEGNAKYDKLKALDTRTRFVAILKTRIGARESRLKTTRVKQAYMDNSDIRDPVSERLLLSDGMSLCDCTGT